MTTYTIAEVAELTGRSEQTVRQHASRGRLAVLKDGLRTLVTQQALDAYMSVDALETAVEAVKAPEADVPREIGNMLSRLPPHVAEAILEGLPTSKRPGSGDAFARVTARLPERPVPEPSDDPHWGFPVGYQHVDAPRWKRSTKNAWSLGDATYSWNGFNWEGGGSRDGALPVDISPADPWSDRRPMAPPKKVSK